MVDPSLEKLLWRQLEKLVDVLALHEEVDEAGHLGDCDLLEEVHLDELPDQPQYQPLLALGGVERVTVDPDDDTADSLG